MIVGVMRVVLHLPDCHSLKEKRSVVKSLLSRLQSQLKLSAAEVEDQDKWQSAVIGVTCVANDVRHADAVLASVASFIDARVHDAVLAGFETELVHVL